MMTFQKASWIEKGSQNVTYKSEWLAIDLTDFQFYPMASFSCKTLTQVFPAQYD